MNFLAILDSELWIFNFGKWDLKVAQIYLEIKLQNLKMAKNDIFGPFEFAIIWFHVTVRLPNFNKVKP